MVSEVHSFDVEQRGVDLEDEGALVQLLVPFDTQKTHLEGLSNIFAGRRRDRAAVEASVVNLHGTDR